VGQKVISQTGEADLHIVIESILPTNEQWHNALQPFLNRMPNPSLAITNTFGGAISMISSLAEKDQIVSRDSDGSSLVLRMAQYTTKLVKATSAFAAATEILRTVTVKSLALFLQLAGDDLSVLDHVPLWTAPKVELEDERIDFVAEAQSLLASWLQPAPPPSYITIARTQLLDESAGQSPSSYYSGRTFSALTSELAESHGYAASDQEVEQIRALRKSGNIFTEAALLTAIEAREVMRVANDILAELTGHDFTEDQATGLRKLISLNCILHTKDEYVNDIPQQRLLFFIKHMTRELSNRTEILKVLHAVLPPIKEIYGSFWHEILDAVQQDFIISASEDSLPNIHAALRLSSLLQKQRMQEANDDLSDAWTERKGYIAKVLIRLMSNLSGEYSVAAAYNGLVCEASDSSQIMGPFADRII